MELVPLEKLSHILKKKRQRNGIKQKKAAQIAGISPSHVNRIENNTTNPSYKSIYKLWKTLDQLEQKQPVHAKDLMNQPVDTVSKNDTLEEAAKKMRKNNYSQLPVVENGDCTGRITETRIIESKNPDLSAKEAAGPELMQVQKNTSISVVKEILKDEPAVLVKNNGELEGIITKADLL